MSFELLSFFAALGAAFGLAAACGPDNALDPSEQMDGRVAGAGGVPNRTEDARPSEGATGAGHSQDGPEDITSDPPEDRSLDAWRADVVDTGAQEDVSVDGASSDAAADATFADVTSGDESSVDARPVDAGQDGRPSSDAGIDPRQWRLVRFAVIGDYGAETPGTARVANLVTSWNLDFVITTGDNNYTGQGGDAIDAVVGQFYSRFIGSYAGRYGPGSPTNRFWPSPGNHDWDAQNLQAYTDYFTLPGNERYYDVAQGLVHLFVLDSDPREPDGTTVDSVQAQWLRARLARSTACFKVVYFHHPAYSSGSHGSSFEMRWPFEAWGADAVLAGHDHDYERFEVGQIPYFTVGLGGSSIYPFVSSLPESRTRYSADYGAMRVTAYRRGIRFEFMDANGTLIESFTSRKRCP